MKQIWIGILCVLLTFLFPVQVVLANENETKLSLTAKSAIVMEAQTGKILYEDNATQALPPASVTKVMTLLLIFEAMDQGKLGLEDEVTVSEHAASMGGSQVFLEAGEVQSVEVMIKSISIASGNDAAVAMAEFVAGSEEAFVQKMNEKAKELGMEQTVFKNCCGLDTDGHVTSAKDIALMSRELITKYPKVLTYSSTWMDEFTHKTKRGESAFTLSNTNKLLKQYQGCTGLKTGSTSKAKFCLSATATRNDLTLIAVVMASNSSKERVQDAAALLDYGFANCQIYQSPDLSKKLKPVSVSGGDKETVAITAKQDFTTVLTADESPEKVTYQIQRKRNLKAPVKKGAPAGWITFYYNGTYIGKVQLVTKCAVGRLTFGKSIRRVFGWYFFT
jgi:D-alanyl-D-alanine carboxypeptidase (penicillin-binding protein 5/6)